MTAKKYRILTESSGSLTSGYIIKAIKSAGYVSICSDIDTANVGRYIADEFVIMPKANDEKLWERINTAITGFLNEYRNQGGLRGGTPAAAFFVKCDAENNPDNLIAQGEVNIEVGVALQYPAEFVIITLSQKTAN